jgi:acetyltransferase
MLDYLLKPESIVVIGASRTSGKVGYEIMVNLKEGGYEGEIIPVNPHADEIMGIQCYKDISEYSGTVELSVIALSPDLVETAVKDSITAGAKAIIVVSSGFGESGTKGRKIQNSIKQLCSNAKVRLLGPNCLGLINTDNRMNVSFSKRLPKTGGLSVISQSGAICTAMLDWAANRNLGLAKVVSIGNEADLNKIDFLKAFAADEKTSIIVAYFESITSGKEFIQAARAAAEAKPLILLSAGFTKAGRWAASVHTGHLPGDGMAYAAAFRRSGIIRAETFGAMFDYATAFLMQPLPKGDRVAIITNSGGPGVMAADAVEQKGMKMATLGEDIKDNLKKKLPKAATVYNPIDILGDADSERYITAVNFALQDDSIDSIILIITPHSMVDPAKTLRDIADNSGGKKPILAVLLGCSESIADNKDLADCKLPFYSSPERAVSALRAMYEYSTWHNLPKRVVTRFPVNRRRVERIISRHTKSDLTQIGEVRAKEILKAYDFNVPDGDIAGSPEEAVEIAERIGFPVAMKIISPDIVHKSDVGGIKLNISSSEEVCDTYDLLTLRVGRRSPEAQLNGVYVEKMCKPGLQVILGMSCNSQFGPMLIFGMGGTFVDVLNETSYYMAPITADEAMQMLKETRSYSLLKSARGQANVDLSAIVGGLQRISQLATDFPQITELNINPFVVGSPGTEPMVVDARITILREGMNK